MGMRCRIALSVSCLCALLTGCNSLPGKPSKADRPLRPAQVTDFDLLYDQQCAGCHGADGRLGAARPLNDALYLAVVGDTELRQIIAHGVGTLMPAFAESAGGGLTDAQIDILIRGMRAQWGHADQFTRLSLPPYGAPAAGEPPASASRGADAYDAYCAQCHGADGKGGDKGGSVVDDSYLALVSDQGLRTAIVAGRVDLGMPTWRDNVPGKPMSEQEITDVVAWLASHRTRFPGAPYAVRPAE